MSLQSTLAMQAQQTELLPKLPVITVVPDANPVLRRGPAAVVAQQRAFNSTWNATFSGCCCSVAPTYCCVVTCCPCTTIASVKESLGGGYERTLMYFGGLAFGILICIGFAASNNNDDHTADPVDDPAPPHHSGGHKTFLWEAAALALLVTFLLGVLRLRMQTRQLLRIEGSWAIDCLSSFFCCFCVISQLHLELKGHHEEPAATRRTQYCRRQGNGNFATTCPVDTLAPYAVM